MKKILVYIICLFNFSWSIGVESLIIPQRASILALSGSGIAGNIDIGINPSSIESPYLGFSNNTWLAGVTGQKSTWIFEGKANRFISFESMGIDDIEYHSDNDSDPEGYVSANWFAVDFGSKINFKQSENFQLGYNIKFNYSKIYMDNSWGYSFDLGATHSIDDHLRIGYIIKNIGAQYYNSQDNDQLDPYIGIGFAHDVNILKSELFFIDLSYYVDIITYQENEIFKLGLTTKLPFINLMIGSSYANGYRDMSYGLSFKAKKWMLVFGNLNHENPALGNPQSIELRKYF